MEWNAARAVSAVFALAMAAMLAGQAHASCGKSQRIAHDDADCLDAGWDNSTDWASTGKVWARNLCPEHGTVVAKVDIKGGNDKTWYLHDGEKKSAGTNVLNTREVSCCSDLSDLCNESELNDSGCRDRFKTSSADQTCVDISAGFTGSSQCEITAECIRSAGNYRSTSITAEFREVKDLSNCNGDLKVGECD